MATEPVAKRLRTEEAREAQEAAQQPPPLRDEQQRTTEWYELRRGCVNASQLSKPLGLFQRRDHASGAFDDRERAAFFQQLRDRALDPPLDEDSAEKCAWGTANESLVLACYQQLRGDAQPPRDAGSVAHPRFPWLRASPDGLVGDDGLVEVKCPFKLKDDMPPAEDFVQNGRFRNFWIMPHYLAQMAVQLEVADREWVDHAVATCHGVRVERVPRDRVFFQGLMYYIEPFYYAATHNMPLPELTHEDRARIRAIFQAHVSKVAAHSAAAREQHSYLGSHRVENLL